MPDFTITNGNFNPTSIGKNTGNTVTVLPSGASVTLYYWKQSGSTWTSTNQLFTNNNSNSGSLTANQTATLGTIASGAANANFALTTTDTAPSSIDQLDPTTGEINVGT